MPSPWKITYADGKAEVTHDGVTLTHITRVSIDISPNDCIAVIYVVRPDFVVIPDKATKTMPAAPIKRGVPGEWDAR